MSEFERTQRIYCLGDSHCLPLKDKVIHLPMEKTPLFVSSNYLVGFCSTEFLDSSGQLAPNVTEILKQNGLANEEGQNIWGAFDRTATNLAFAAGSIATTPILMIFCGDIDLRGHIFKQFQDVYDFDMPDGEWGIVPDAKKLPYDAVEDLLTARYTPIVQGIAALYGAGFVRTYLAALPLPSQENEEDFAAAHGFRCPLTTRVKLTKLSNEILARLCRVANVPFVDISDDVGDKGLLAKEHRLDGFHMTTQASIRLVDTIIEHAVHNSSSHVNQKLYEHARDHSEAPTCCETAGFQISRDEFLEKAVTKTETDCSGIL